MAKDVKIIQGENIKETVKKMINSGWKVVNFSSIDNGAKNAYTRNIIHTCMLIKEDR